MNKGLLIVVSGPSGSGKGTVMKALTSMDDSFALSISATTRKPRDGEIDGVSYYFIDHDEFENRIKNGMMLEYAEYCGNYYGTPAKEVNESLEAGKNVILEIEVEGAMQIKKKCPDALLIMIAPPSYKTLEARLRGRGDNVAESVLEERLEKAKEELGRISEYNYMVVNEDNGIEKAARDIICIVDSEKKRTERIDDFKKVFFAE